MSSWLALSLTPGLRPDVARAVAGRLGGPAGVLAASRRARVEAGLAERAARDVDAAAARAERERRKVDDLGGRVVDWAAPEYPPALRTIADAPLALLVAGDTEVLARPALAIVGARRASGEGRGLAAAIGRDLAAAGLLVVSGLAAGIDAAAHGGALDGGGATVAVMATGLDDVYPRWHRALAARIRERGALVTEYPTETPPLPMNFPRRNRIVSGLGSGVIVVEARGRSGSLVTARLALEQNRLVFAVPGDVGRSLHEGTNGLLRDGAILVRSAADVLEDVAPQLLPALEEARARRSEASLSREEALVVDALRSGHYQLESLMNSTGMALGRLSEVLLTLELRGLIAETAGKRFRLRAAYGPPWQRTS
jgi:DNA processing protein